MRLYTPPMRLLVGMPDPASLGGPATCEPPLVAELRRAGLDVTEEVYVYGDRFDGITLLQRARRVFRTASRFRALTRSSRFDVVHLNTAFDFKALLRDVICVSAMRRHVGSLFLKLHGCDPSFLRTRNPVVRVLRRILLAQVDAVGALSSEERDGLLALGLPRSKVVVVKNAVEPLAAASPSDAMEDRGSEAPPTMLFVARMVASKRLIDVVRACGLLAAAGRDVRLVCVGDGPSRAESEAAADDLGLGGRVRFVGYVPESETHPYYATSTALVFPTETEGFSLTIFNAVASGLPVLTTRIRAAADYLSEPANCLWVDPGDPERLAARIAELLDDPELRATMAANNRELARLFRAAAIVDEYVELYDSLVSGATQPEQETAVAL